MPINRRNLTFNQMQRIALEMFADATIQESGDGELLICTNYFWNSAETASIEDGDAVYTNPKIDASA